MDTLVKFLPLTALLVIGASLPSIAGPVVVPNPITKSVRVLNNDFKIVCEFYDPAPIKVIQDAFLRARKIGKSNSFLIVSTHKIDFSDRWLLDLNSGKFQVLSKSIKNVYQLGPQDLKTLQHLILNKAQQATAPNCSTDNTLTAP